MLFPQTPETSRLCESLARSHIETLVSVASSLGHYEVAEWLAGEDAARQLGRKLHELWQSVSHTDLWAHEPFEGVDHDLILFRTLADEAVKAAIGDGVEGKQTSSNFQAAVLQAQGRWSEDFRQELDPELFNQIAQVRILHVPPVEMLRAQRALEQCTGVPWRLHRNDSGSEADSLTGAAAEYRCRLGCEGATRVLIQALNKLGKSKYPDERMAWIVETTGMDGDLALEVAVPSDVAEDPYFVQALFQSEEMAQTKLALGSKQFVADYTRFQHQPSALLEMQANPRAGARYEEFVVEKKRVEQEALLAGEIERLTRISCLPPDGIGSGYCLFFEHESTRNLAELLMATMGSRLSLDRTGGPWTVKLHRYDRRHELHVPVSWVESEEFRASLQLNSEVREAFRAVAMEDRALLLDITSAQEDFTATAGERAHQREVGKVAQRALDYDTSLTSAFRGLVLDALVYDRGNGSAEDFSRLASSLGARNLNELLTRRSLLWLLENESARIRMVEDLVQTAAQELQKHRIEVSPHYEGRSFAMSVEQQFCTVAERYLDPLDRQVTGIAI